MERQAELIDTYGRRISYVRLSVTDRCDLRCRYCMAEQMEFLPRAELLALEELVQLADAFIARGVTRIRLTGGDACGSEGYYVNPTVMVDVHPDMSVVREEIFGPVLVAQRFDDLDEVAKAANDTLYGLGASIWTKDLSNMHRLAAKIKSGTVWGNCHSVIDPALPFGGYKQSGLGREQARQGVEAYTELKTVVIALS